jgi:hypothetical protein
LTIRVGQGYYRQELIKIFRDKSAVTNNVVEAILIASHIVPWLHLSDEESIDPDNEILLSPLYDALFDKHMITFRDDGIMKESTQFTTSLSKLNIDKT